LQGRLINSIYRNLFNRDAGSAGLQFYVEQRLVPYRAQWTAEHGGSSVGATEYALSRIALDILNGAQGDDLVVIGNKLAVTKYFTERVVRRGVVYDVPDIPAVRDILAQVTAAPASVTAAQAAVDSMIATMRISLRAVGGNRR
jgi:hypothetical protein